MIGMVGVVSDRDRLLLALTELVRYGVAAEESLPGTADEARERLLVDLWTRAPGALGSYAFWLRTDETCFGPDGSLRAALPLHTSDDVHEPLQFLLARAGFEVHTSGPDLLVTVALTEAA
ncbi:hypothetical protein GCM10010472_37990 [Pseudonocardia halophobica]|uniref:Uncharacterized protein n=1 Tax=Pseudonocardia halophobica TaxID=29401 RepID=A0A9W6NY39_9PSEU|nr:hypothetical protein [Pseudonocardia halophobica]GLL14125.1 hypothetical protein GCM10017577_52710 [Pseudonocardia halophobica]